MISSMPSPSSDIFIISVSPQKEKEKSNYIPLLLKKMKEKTLVTKKNYCSFFNS